MESPEGANQPTSGIYIPSQERTVNHVDYELTYYVNDIESKSINLWMDECPNGVVIECYSDRGLLSLYNIFEKLDAWGKGKYSQTAYSGMILERRDNIYLYKCNDTGIETDFDKLVFEIEMI